MVRSTSAEGLPPNLREICDAVAGGNDEAIGQLRHVLLEVDLARLDSLGDELVAAVFLAKELVDRLWANFGTDASFPLDQDDRLEVLGVASAAARILLKGLDGSFDSQEGAKAIGAYFRAVRRQDELIRAARSR